MKLNLSEEKNAEIQKFLISRFTYLESLRKPLDDEIKEDIDVYNDIDKNLNAKEGWEEKYKVPYIYTIVQTMDARIIQSLFSRDNYVKLFIERDQYLNIEKHLTSWVQEELDKIKLKSRSRDFIEEALIQRTSWLQLRPIVVDNKLTKMEFDILKWFDVWFDTKAKTVEETDFFIRKIQKLYKIKGKDNIYFNLDLLETTTPPEDIKGKQEYNAKHGKTYYDPEKNNVTDEIELMEWYGCYDLGEDKDNPDFQEVIFTLANRTLLIRAEKNTMETKKKRLLFPIRPLRQASSLIGKSVSQIVKGMQYELNEVRSLRMQHLKLLVNLLFKYKRDADIDFDELFAMGGNAVGYSGDPNDIDVMHTPNYVKELSFVAGDIIQDMQQTTGAVDYVMGTSAGRGITETASGIKSITEQAMFKFGMMVTNIYDDILEFINFVMILWIKHEKKDIILRYPEIKDFLDQTETMLEETHFFDIALRDLSERRDIERTQWIQMINVVAPLVEKVGGNLKETVKQFMKKLEMDNVDYILEPDQAIQQQMETMRQINTPEGQQMIQMYQQAMAMKEEAAKQQQTPVTNDITGGGVSPVAPQMSAALPEELAQEVNVGR